jgi:TatD DNase family protein
MLIDSHCHIQSSEFYPENKEDVYRRAVEAGVRMIVVGTSEADSRAAVEFSAARDDTWAVVGVHPHDAKGGWQDIKRLLAERPAKLVGIGEIGLDYFYDNSPRDVQIRAFEEQLQWATEYDLPVSFHVRGAYEDFWPVFDNFKGIRGVLHSFTDSQANLEEGLKRGLFVGVNGISTFTKDEAQKAMYKSIPPHRLLLETDAPFLTPAPFRGRVNEPAYVREVAKHQASIMDIPFGDIVSISTANAEALFALI